MIKVIYIRLIFHKNRIIQIYPVQKSFCTFCKKNNIDGLSIKYIIYIV